MKTRVLYLHYQHATLAGQAATAGKQLVQALENEFDQVIQAHIVDDDNSVNAAHHAYKDDAVGFREIMREGINVIYCEGGIRSSLVDNEGRYLWKIKLDYAQQFIREGGILIVADIDRNYAGDADDAFSKFCGLDFHYGGSESSRGPIYFVDNPSGDGWHYLLKIDVLKMKTRVSEWLRPLYEGITEIMVDGPLEIHPRQDGLAFVVSETAGTLCLDEWWSAPRRGIDSRSLRYHREGPYGPDFLGPFASVQKFGRGYVVAITGLISTDRLVSGCPGNALWIAKFIRHLQAATKNHLQSNAFSLNRGIIFFLSHRSVDKPAVSAVSESLRRNGLRVWLDSDRILPSDSLGTALGAGLNECSHSSIARVATYPWTYLAQRDGAPTSLLAWFIVMMICIALGIDLLDALQVFTLVMVVGVFFHMRLLVEAERSGLLVD